MSLLKYRIRDVATDFGVAPKEIVEIISKFYEKPKSNTQVMTEDELNVVFDVMTQTHQISSLEQVFAVQPKAAPKAEAPAKAEKPAKAAKSKAAKTTKAKAEKPAKSKAKAEKPAKAKAETVAVSAPKKGKGRGKQAQPQLPEGKLKIHVEVCNTLANRLDGKALPSGLLGPVKLG